MSQQNVKRLAGSFLAALFSDVSRFLFGLLPLLVFGAGDGFAADAPASAADPFDALAKGRFAGSFRYRYETYEQDTVPGASTVAAGRIDDAAVASTLRVLLGYESRTFAGFSASVDVEGVYAIGSHDHYRISNHAKQGALPFAVISDPTGTAVNQAFLNWSVPDTPVRFRVGREALRFNNERFISFSAWRQNNQSIDLASVTAPLGGGVTANYAYLDKVHRVVGPDASDGSLGMGSHLAGLSFGKPGVINASLYGLWLDYDLASQSANDTRSLGLRLAGPYKLGPSTSLIYTADFARQNDIADNVAEVSLNYWQFEFGLERSGQKIFAGWTVLDGTSAAVTFRTPLANPHNGWVEKFLNNPAFGLDARYLTITGPVPGGVSLTYTATFYDYHARSRSQHYGTELDLALEWKAVPIHKNLTIGWRFGDYFAKTLFTDSLRTSGYVTFAF